MEEKLLFELAECLEDSLEDADLWYSETDMYAELAELSSNHHKIKTRSRDILRKVDNLISKEKSSYQNFDSEPE